MVIAVEDSEKRTDLTEPKVFKGKLHRVEIILKERCRLKRNVTWRYINHYTKH